VTLAQALRRRFPWRKVAPYMLAQLIGAFVAAAIVYGDSHGAIDSLNRAMHVTRGTPKSVATYSIFATFPATYLHSWVSPFLDQVLGPALLVGLFAVIDELNAPVKGNLAPFVIGLIARREGDLGPHPGGDRWRARRLPGGGGRRRGGGDHQPAKDGRRRGSRDG
jgi:glycerol uptake facilitator protein